MKKTTIISALVSLFMSLPAMAGLTVSTDLVSFGDVPVGTSSQTQTITVFNSGSNPVEELTVDISGNDKEYSLIGCNDIIFPGQVCNIQVTLIPLHYGNKKKKLNIDGVEVDATTAARSEISITIPMVGTSDNPNKP